MSSALVLPAAGTGSRLGGPAPKQLVAVAGKPLLVHALERFRGLVEEAVLPVSAGIHDAVAAALKAADLGFATRLVAGGPSRLLSVAAGIAALDPAADRVLIHDAARPLVPPACIRACLAALRSHRAAVVAIPCSATVKRVIDGVVVETVPRDGLWLAQTPQGFHRDLADELFGALAGDDPTISDDVQLCERAGIRPAVVPGDPANLKVTDAGDLALARIILERGGAAAG